MKILEYTLHTKETAPDESRHLLDNSVKLFGMIPGLHGVMAESPALLEAYQVAHDCFSNGTSFDNDELTVVWQSINVDNGCHYCVPAHSAIANSMGVSNEIDNALRNKTPLPNARLEALRDFTLRVSHDRGHLNDNAINDFLAAGFTKRHILEVILGYSQKVMSNYTNHIANTPVDKIFRSFV